MDMIFLFLGLGCAGFGIAIFAAANGAIHEIEAFLLFLIAAVFISTSAILTAIGRLKSDNKK